MFVEVVGVVHESCDAHDVHDDDDDDLMNIPWMESERHAAYFLHANSGGTVVALTTRTET